MNRDGLLALCHYDAHANSLMFEVVAKLTEDEFTRDSSPSHGSVRNLMLHTLRTERGFLSLCQEREGKKPDLRDAAEIQHYWEDLDREMRDWIASQSEDDLRTEIALPFQLKGGYYRLPKWQLLLQALVHCIQHRGELSIVLTELGHPLPNLDIILHFIERNPKPHRDDAQSAVDENR